MPLNIIKLKEKILNFFEPNYPLPSEVAKKFRVYVIFTCFISPACVVVGFLSLLGDGYLAPFLSFISAIYLVLVALLIKYTGRYYLGLNCLIVVCMIQMTVQLILEEKGL